MMHSGISLVPAALRLVGQHGISTACNCLCGRMSNARLRTLAVMRCPYQPMMSQCRHMSLLYLMRKIPKRFREFKKYQLNIAERPAEDSRYPPEISTYLWLIGMNARVRFTNGKWYTSEMKGLKMERPIGELLEYSIDAVDGKGTSIDYYGMANIIQLKELKFLSFDSCPYIDDSCLGRLVHLKESLTHLNINKCPQITERGLACLHHLRNLERINMNDLPKVPHSKVIACMLEDALPELRISLVSDEVERQRQQKDKWRPAQDHEENRTKQDIKG